MTIKEQLEQAWNDLASSIRLLNRNYPIIIKMKDGNVIKLDYDFVWFYGNYHFYIKSDIGDESMVFFEDYLDCYIELLEVNYTDIQSIETGEPK